LNGSASESKFNLQNIPVFLGLNFSSALTEQNILVFGQSLINKKIKPEIKKFTGFFITLQGYKFSYYYISIYSDI